MTPRRLIEPARLAGTSMLRTQSDARLVDLVRAGHASAFEAIVQRYRKQLLAYCSRLLPSSRAEDAVQQTFLKAYQAMISGDAELQLRPWLYRIAHNASLNLLRQNGWSHEQLDENMDGVQRPDQAVELRERLRSTVAAVNALPDRQRDAVLLREIDGLTYEEIATALGVGDGAVRQLLHRARTSLRAGMTAVTPIGLVERVATMLGSGAGDPAAARVAEGAAGLGLGAGALKLGTAVLATGVIATGAVTVHHSGHAFHRHATADAAAPASASASRAAAPSSTSSGQGSGHRTTVIDDRGGSSSGPGSQHRGKSRHGRHHSSGGSGSGDGQGSGDNHSGSGGKSGDDSGSSHGGSAPSSGKRDGSGDRSGGSDDGTDRHSGSGSGGGSGGGGSDDGAQTPAPSGETEQHTSGDHGGDDNPTVTVPTTTVPPPVVDDSGKDGGDSGGGGGGGKGPDGN